MRINPFLETLQIPIHRVKKRDVPSWKEKLTDEEYFEVESIHFTRIYRGSDRINKMNILLQLLPAALKLYTYIQYYLPKDSDEIKLDDKQLCTVLNLSERQIQKARLCLVDVALICRKQENTYWVNPRYLCSGNRLKMYPNHKQIVSKAVENDYVPPTMYEDLAS